MHDRIASVGAATCPTAASHKGRFTTLKDTITFNVQRDTHPEKGCPLNSRATLNKFDDLPAHHHAPVNTTELAYKRRLGDASACRCASG